MTESRGAFLDYRSPYVWHSRAVNFNRQLIKKLNQVQQCNANKQVAARNGATKKNPARIAASHRSNALASSSFRHRLLEPLSTEVTSTCSSLAPSLSSCENYSEGKEVTTAAAAPTTTFAPSLYPKYQSHAGKKMARNYLEHYTNNALRATTTGQYQYAGHHSSLPFSPPGGRCPVHGSGQHQSYKQHLNYDNSATPAQPRYSSSGEEYPTHLHPHLPHAPYLSTLPYGYHMAYGQTDKQQQQQQHQQYLGHYYPQHYYASSQMYHHLPSSYHHHLPNYHHHHPHHPHHLQYPSPSALFTSKHHLPYSGHQQQQQQQPRRSSNRPFEFTSTATSHSNIRLSGLPSMDHLHSQQQHQLHHHQQQQQTSSSRCKGHLIVLATILSVIIIGTLLGFALAIIS